MNERRLKISFSGGRTSALMLKLILDRMASEYDRIAVTFCNTGQEHEETLKFVNAVDQWLEAGVVWLEAVVHPEHGKGTTHRIVNFETADRAGAVFESVIKKYGIPNPVFRNLCNRELKLRVMDSYCRSIGWETGSYDTAIGIRADEIDRVNPDHRALRLVYPLVDEGVTKTDVLAWWSKQPFDLQIPEHYGNCVWCWKKSLRKHLTLARECPSAFEFPMRMERLYATAGAGEKERTFFRENRSAADILELSKQPFEPFDPNQPLQMPLIPIDLPSGGCSESCETYGDFND